MYIPEQPSEPPPRRRAPLRDYLIGLVRMPSRTFSDIAFDRPWLRGGGLLLGSLVLAGLLLGATGFPWVGGGFRGALGGVFLVPLLGAVVFGVASLAFHGMAKSLEGWASYVEMVSAFIFALLPLALLAPAALLRLLPGGGGGLLFLLACSAIAGWTVYLIFLSVRESHRFSGLQAILAILVPMALAIVVGFVGLVVFLMALLVVG